MEADVGANAMTVTNLTHITTQPRETVEVWNPITNAWDLYNELFCADLQLQLLPSNGISRATLFWRYGEIADGTLGYSPTTTKLSNLERSFVRITCTADNGPPLQWVGLIVASENFNESSGVHGPVYGDQKFEVVGPEWILSRVQLIESDIATGDATTKRVGHAMPFNMRGDFRRNSATEAYPNRDADATKSVFLREDGDAETWNGQEIAEYIRDRFLPDAFPEAHPSTPPWVMDGQDALKWIKPQLPVHGKSLYEIFNELANPRRAMHWKVEYSSALNPNFGQFLIKFASSTSLLIVLPDATSIGGNPDVQILAPRDSTDAEQVVLIDTQQQYEQVVCLGAKFTVGRTFSFGDESLKKGWSTADEDAYKTAQSEAGDYPADRSERYARNAQFRSDRYPYVFTQFLVRTDGTFDIESDDFFDENAMLSSLRFEKETPLLIGWDYSVTTPVARADALGVPDLRNMFAVYELPDGTFAYADKSKRKSELTNYTTSATLTPLENQLGFTLTPGKQPHQQALGVSGIIDFDEESKPEVDYNDILVTGFIEANSHVQGFYPDPPLATRNFMNSQLIIQLGDSARFDLLKADTVVDVIDGKLVRSPETDVILRDDRDYLRSIAIMAWSWYGKARHAANITYKQITTEVPLGSIATSIDGLATDSVVTSIAYNFEQGTTVVSAAYAQPEFQDILAVGSKQKRKLVDLEQQVRKLEQLLNRIAIRESDIEEPKEFFRAITKAEEATPYPTSGVIFPIRYKTSAGTERQATTQASVENLSGKLIPEDTELLVFRAGDLWFTWWIPQGVNTIDCASCADGIPLPMQIKIGGITDGNDSGSAAALNATLNLVTGGLCEVTGTFHAGDYTIGVSVTGTTGSFGWRLFIEKNSGTLFQTAWDTDAILPENGSLADCKAKYLDSSGWTHDSGTSSTTPSDGPDMSAITIEINSNA